MIVQCATFSKSLNPQNINKSVSDIWIPIRFPFQSRFWISVSGCKLTILPDIQPSNRIVIICASNTKSVLHLEYKGGCSSNSKIVPAELLSLIDGKIFISLLYLSSNVSNHITRKTLTWLNNHIKTAKIFSVRSSPDPPIFKKIAVRSSPDPAKIDFSLDPVRSSPDPCSSLLSIRDEHWTGLGMNWIETIANFVEFGSDPVSSEISDLRNF